MTASKPDEYYLNNVRHTGKRSEARKKMLQTVKLKVKGDETNTNVFDANIHYLDQVGNIRTRDKRKLTVYRAEQLELIVDPKDKIVEHPIVLSEVPPGVNPIIANIQQRNEQTIIRRETRSPNDGIDPTGLRETIKEYCGEKGELIVEKLCEIAFPKKPNPRSKDAKKPPKYTPKDEIEALKMLVYYFAGKPQEITNVNKNVTQNIEKKVANFYRTIQGGKE